MDILQETGVFKGPLNEPGLVRKLDDDYFKRVEAIEFAVKYDDGRDPRGILRADIVISGCISHFQNSTFTIFSPQTL